jgi:hypothetical protein
MIGDLAEVLRGSDDVLGGYGGDREEEGREKNAEGKMFHELILFRETRGESRK